MSTSSTSMRTFVVHVQDLPGVLTRVASLFRRRGYNIHSLNVSNTHEPGVSRMTILLEADACMAGRIEANLYKLVNVLRVDDITERAAVERDLALIKVRVGAERRAEILQICEVFRARAVDISPENLIIEITGTRDKILGLVQMLQPFGIEEMVQTGAIAMTRGAACPEVARSIQNSGIRAA
ncbi:MAG: acetolactate synthase small subunit [Myxococcales bacterium]|nr:acetolactate synthase small subunit [Myxococcales bacterium]